MDDEQDALVISPDAVLRWHPSSLILPLGQGLLRLYQTATRHNLVCDAAVLPLIDELIAGTTPAALAGRLGAEAKFRAVNATEFSLWPHAFSNPDFYQAPVAAQVPQLTLEELLAELVGAGFAVDHWPPKLDLQRRAITDRYKGNFYEQIGTECLYHRVMPVDWWVNQKFTPDRSETRETPYRYIQDRFLERYFSQSFDGKEVLEIGCGTGYYTNKIARHAAKAVGMDYEESYVQTARERWPANPRLEFHVGNILDLSAGGGMFADRKFDAIILIDTFLFLFETTYQQALAENRFEIMRNIAQLLRDDGCLVIMDPSPFWLTPWFGDEQMPFGIVTEYRSRRLKVIPSAGEMTEFFFRTGFRVRRILEPQISAEYAAVDPRAQAFMSQFPQWWVYELEKADRAAR